ncbi:hypothetical protein QBZ16_005020 [Prototheca wickerhamii]|uniref:Uncharacterized protein n=1 Tax=Prototheca wickerhamii TaxID=3111 RepID=A0AAD9IGP1_PROWI|nr:hypothetical protein QBZ16_005020 [Prototheca wickerhamii]
MVTHPIPGNGYVPPSKIFLAFGGALAVVSAVFAYQAKKAYVPPTLNRDWEDASYERILNTPFEAAPETTYHANPFYFDVKPSQYLKTE